MNGETASLRKTILAHFIHKSKGVLYQLYIQFAPSVGDELRFHGEAVYKVIRLVWVYDETSPYSRLNIEIKEVT